MRPFIKTTCFIISIFVFKSSICILYSQVTFSRNVTIGTQAGYSIITGHYSDSLNNGIGAGFFSFVPFTGWAMLNGAFLYNRFSLAHSHNSSMQSFCIAITPALYYNLPYDFTTYTGAGLSLQYYTLSAIKTNAYDSTSKTGLMASAGIAKSIFDRTIVVIETTYHLSELSHKKFQTVAFSIKAGYQFALRQPEYYITKEEEKAKIREKQIEYHFTCGKEYMQKKDHIHALDCFNQVLSLKPDHKESLQYIASISKAVEQYKSAQALLQQNRELEALPLLASSSFYIAQAESIYKNMQIKYKPSISELQKKAIESFNNQNYDDCIATMNTVLLIDPDNAVASAYITRSKRIKETIHKLQ